MAAPGTFVGRILRTLFGTVQWQAPPWGQQSARWCRRHQRPLSITMALLGVLLASAWFGYQYWLSLPKPAITRISIEVPALTDVGEDDKLYPKPLRLRFSVHYPDPTAEGPRNAAKLSLLGEKVAGIRLTPEHPGSWVWSDENTLTFSTEQDWPSGQKYEIALPADIFADSVRLETDRPEFRTLPFTVALQKLAFYQDPEQPTRHQTVATLRFSHAVSVESLRQLAEFSMRASGAPVTATAQKYAYSIRTGVAGREAYLSTDPLALPEEENFMELQIAPGIRPLSGADKTTQKISQTVRIPSLATYFRVGSMETQVIRNEDDDPEQTLIIEMTDAVRTDVVSSTLQAWELPANYYHRGGAEVPETVMKQATPLSLTGNPSEHEFSHLHSFRFRAGEGRALLIRLPAGLESRGGFRMTVPYEAVLYAPHFPREMTIVGDGGLLALSGDRKLGFQTRGLHGIEVEVHQLFEDQLVHLVSQTYGRMRDANFSSGAFNELNIGKKHSRKIMIAETDPARAAYASLDLGGFLTDLASNKGTFVINAYGLDKNGYRSGPSDRRLLLVSDMAMISKRDATNAHAVFVLSLSKQSPVAGATVSLLGRNGRVLMSRSSDATGKADFPDVSDYSADRQPVAWLVKNGQDLAFMPFASHDRTVNYSRFDVGGIYTGRADGTSTVRAMVFSDRGIYRPGEQGHLAVMSKRDDWQTLPSSPIEIIVTDPRGNPLLNQRQRLAADGLQEVAFALAATAPTGQYQVSVNLITDERHQHWTQIGSGSFSVEEFQPDTMRIRSRLEVAQRAGWNTELKLRGKVTLENLFGAPAQDRRVQASYSVMPARFSFAEYEGYVFDNPYRDQKDSLQRRVSETLPEQRSDEEGLAGFDIDLSGYGHGLYQLTFEAEGFDSGGGRSVSARSQLLVSPLSLLVGSKADGDLEYLRRDSERNIRFVVLDPDLKSVASENFSLRLTEVQSLSTLVRQRDGTLAYQTIQKKVPLSDEALPLAEGGTDWRVPTDRAGDFTAELVNAEGLVVARRSFSVIGSRNLAGNLEKNAELQLKLDRSDYRAGDLIEMQITAPYTGMGLITIERNRVFSQKWFRADAQRSVQSIRVPDGIEGNAYVNVTFVRSLDSEEIFAQPLSVAVQPFSVDRDKRNIALTVTTAAKVAPGQTLAMEVDAAAAGKMVLFAIDEGILQVAGYNTPAPLDTFLRKRALEVTTQQIADMLLPEFSLLQQRAAAGGDAARERAAMLGMNLNPFQRGVRAPVVYWSGVVDAKRGKQTLQFTVPDYFDGQLRVMAVISNADGVGATSTSTLVRDAFVLSPNVITAVAPGDEFEVSVGIANTLEAEEGEQTLTVTVKPDAALSVLDATPKTVSLMPGRETRLSFRVRATDKLGGGELVFRAVNDRYDVRRSATLSVRPALPYRVSVNAAIGDDAEQSLSVPRRLHPELAEQQMVAGYSPTVLTSGLERYLQHYPHACSEQIVSRVFPAVAMLADAGSGIDRAATLERIAGVAATLATRQAPRGGYSFWPGSAYVDDAVSVYALHFLLEARQQGLSVTDAQIRKAEDYLRTIAGAQPGPYRAETQAYAIYVLTRSGVVTTNFLTLLQTHLEKADRKNWKKSLAAAWMAASYRQLKLEDLARDLIGQYQFEDVTRQYDWPLDSALLRNAQYLYLLAKHFPEKLDTVSKDVLMQLALPVSKGQFNTLSASWTVLALSAWGEQAAAAEPEALTVLMQIGEQALQTLAASQPGVTRVSVDVPLTAQTLTVRADKSQRFFYSFSQAGYDTTLPDKQISNGIEIQRRYLDQEGREVETANLGDELTVRIALRSVDGMRHANVAVVDLLPGGFEVQRDSVRGQGQLWSTDYVDIREDRLVLYGTVSTEVKHFQYRVKLTGQGSFVTPPAFAESMYHRHVHGQGVAGRFVVGAPTP